MSDNHIKEEEENTQDEFKKEEKPKECTVWAVIIHDTTPTDDSVEVLGVYARREDAVKVLYGAAVEYDGKRLLNIMEVDDDYWFSTKEEPKSRYWGEIQETTFSLEGCDLWKVVEGSEESCSDECTFYSRDAAIDYMDELKEEHIKSSGCCKKCWDYGEDEILCYEEIKWIHEDSYIRMYKSKVQ